MPADSRQKAYCMASGTPRNQAVCVATREDFRNLGTLIFGCQGQVGCFLSSYPLLVYSCGNHILVGKWVIVHSYASLPEGKKIGHGFSNVFWGYYCPKAPTNSQCSEDLTRPKAK